MYAGLCLLGMLVGLFAGGLGSVLGIIVAVILFAASVVAAKIEVKDDPTYLWGLSFSLIWLGATVGQSWPIWRWPLIGLGLILAAVLGFVFWKKAENSQ